MVSSKITDIMHITNEIIKNEGQEKFKVVKECIDFIKERNNFKRTNLFNST